MLCYTFNYVDVEMLAHFNYVTYEHNFPLKFYYALVTLYWFMNTCLVSSGSVTINDDSSVQILAEEACPVDNLDAQVVWPFYFGCVFLEKFIFKYFKNADFNIANF